MGTKGIEVHPVQRYSGPTHMQAVCPKVVTMRAYEVYSKVFAPQEALVTGDCRGGFGVSELIAFLYARSFPESEWRMRFREAGDGIKNL
jgi:hypothetical protein